MINDQSVLQGIPDNVTISDLSKYIVRTNRNYDLPIIVSAYEFAFQAHGDQKRSSGEPYIVHPLSVAWILVSITLFQNRIAVRTIAVAGIAGFCSIRF